MEVARTLKLHELDELLFRYKHQVFRFKVDMNGLLYLKTSPHRRFRTAALAMNGCVALAHARDPTRKPKSRYSDFMQYLTATR